MNEWRAMIDVRFSNEQVSESGIIYAHTARIIIIMYYIGNTFYDELLYSCMSYFCYYYYYYMSVDRGLQQQRCSGGALAATVLSAAVALEYKTLTNHEI